MVKSFFFMVWLTFALNCPSIHCADFPLTIITFTVENNDFYGQLVPTMCRNLRTHMDTHTLLIFKYVCVPSMCSIVIKV